jgi:hypothetical protein
MHSFLAKFIVAAGLVAGGVRGASAEPAPFMMRATIGGVDLEGQPLTWTKTQMVLLGRDGMMYEFDPAAAQNAKRTAPAYTGYTNSEMQSLVRQEFGKEFQVSSTAHFVVVHPRGQWNQWGDRLESLYRSFVHYMAVRGFTTEEPRAPLVAVVFRNKDAYFANAKSAGVTLHPNTLGHYDPVTNRVHLFDVGMGEEDWAINAETIIHEATHQTAYNVGVHTRFAEQPRWAVEGLAMMFEGRGVWDGAANRTRTDRINRYRLDSFRQQPADRPSDWLVKLVASDTPFETDALAAYADAWTLTFYLCETRPQAYSAYLARVAAREPFSEYAALERVANFQASFGADLNLLESQLKRWVSELP